MSCIFKIICTLCADVETICAVITTIVAICGLMIAYKQLIQPQKTNIKFGEFVTQKLHPVEKPLFHIRYFNNGFKTIFIESIGYCIDDSYITFPEDEIFLKLVGAKEEIEFPYALVKDTFIDVSIEYSSLRSKIKSSLDYHNKGYSNNISFAYEDCDKRIHKSKSVSVNQFYKCFDKIYSNE